MFGCFASLAEELRFRLVQARLRHVFGLCTGALFFFLGGSKGAVLDPPNVLFFAVPKLGFRWCLVFSAVPALGFRWCLAVSHPLPRSCVFGLSRLGCAMFLVYVLGLFSSSFRGFQRCCFGPAKCTVFCCASARI